MLNCFYWKVEMAGSLNKVLLIGRLGNDPETREFPNGGKVCNFSLATSESWKDNNTGERQERTSWHNIAIFNDRLAEIAEQYLKKTTNEANLIPRPRWPLDETVRPILGSGKRGSKA